MSYKSVHYHYRYAYVGNDPINYTDPFGLSPSDNQSSGIDDLLKLISETPRSAQRTSIKDIPWEDTDSYRYQRATSSITYNEALTNVQVSVQIQNRHITSNPPNIPGESFATPPGQTIEVTTIVITQSKTTNEYSSIIEQSTKIDDVNVNPDGTNDKTTGGFRVDIPTNETFVGALATIDFTNEDGTQVTHIIKAEP